MREYKLISLVAVILYLVSFCLINYFKINKNNIENDEFLINQLQYINSITKNNSISIMGSSGVLLGLSAKDINKKTGILTINLASMGQGAEFNKYIEFIYKYNNPGGIAIIGDRNYRKTNYIDNEEILFLDVLKKFSFIFHFFFVI